MAQEATPTAPAEPVPLFQAACINGAVRLNKSIAEATPFAALPAGAQRALGASTVATRGEAEKLPVPTAAQVPNTIYRIAGGQLYLVAPTAQPSHNPIGDSCIVLWHALSDEDYFAARRLVLPNEETVPLTARPTASAVGASVATSAGDSVRMTAAAYGGWVVLRSSSLTESKAPGAQ
ncbi:hypothetical protein ACCC88_15360 [Sphingomonas sp. Sphisp140]|uniref:hypothetical protein n=1 Tax=unclassified Sphingomonas TaxID=196159 RepID=UPI0039AEE4C2